MTGPTLTCQELVEALPPPPPVLAALWRLVRGSKAGADDLVAALGSAPQLMSYLIRTSNSPYFGHRRRISSLKSAVTLLGFHQVKDIALTEAIKLWLVPNRPAANGFDRQSFWRHCLSCGIVGDQLTQQLDGERADMAFVAGLTHDLGALVLDVVAPETLGMLILAERGGADLAEHESRLLGCRRAELGGLVAAKHGFPEPLVEIIAGRGSDVQRAVPQRLGTIMHLADALGTDAGALYDGVMMDDAEIQQFGQDIGLGPSTIDSIQAGMLSRLGGATELLRLPLAA